MSALYIYPFINIPCQINTHIYTHRGGEIEGEILQFMALDSLELNSSSSYGEIYSWAGLGLSPGMRTLEDEYSNADGGEEEIRRQAAVVDYEEVVLVFVVVVVVEIAAFQPNDDLEETLSQSLVA